MQVRLGKSSFCGVDKILKNHFQVKITPYDTNVTSSAVATNLIKPTRFRTYETKSFLKVPIMFLLLNLPSLLACYAGSGETGEHMHYIWDIEKSSREDEDYVNMTGYTNITDRAIHTAWAGWIPIPTIMHDWVKWFKRYRSTIIKTNFINDLTDQETKDRLAKERGPGSGWPEEWKGLGVGQGGVPVPPWAYAPVNTGRPHACLQRPRKGECPPDDTRFKKDGYARFGFNAYSEMCEEYTYSGCGGTPNNFKTKLLCEERCAIPVPPGCAGDSGIPIHQVIIP